MKILIPMLGFGKAGGYRVLSQLANYWIAGGNQVDFLVHAESDEPYFPTVAGIWYASCSGRIERSKPANLNSSSHFRVPRILFSLLLGVLKIAKNYDIVLANHSLSVLPVALAYSRNVKKYYYIQAYEPEYYALEPGLKPRILKYLSTISYDLNLTQVCNAPMYIGYKRIKAREWVPPGIDFNLFYPKREIKDLSSAGEIIIGCIGRREPAKGIRYVLDAFEVLSKSDSRYKLHVAFGNLPDSWTHPQLTVVMPSNDKELGEFYRSLDILVAPGTEQLGAPHYPVMEAMACGVPVVTTGYLPADESNSWIVEVNDSRSIVSAVLELVANNDRHAKSVRAAEDISAFSWENASKKFMDIFNKV